MAHPTGTTARVQRLTTLVAVLAVAITAGIGYGRIYQGGATTLVMVGTGVAAGTLAWAFERRSLLLATAASLVALVLAVTWLVFPDTTWYGLPTLDTLRAIGEAAGQVGTEARVRVSPTEPIDPLVMAGIVGIWAAIFSCHALAFRAGSPLLALVPPLALIVFADSVLDEFVRPIFGVFFLIAALAVVFADAMRRLQGWGPVWTGPSRTTRLLPSTGRSARRIAATVTVAAAVAPLVIPGFGSRAVIDISAVNRDDRVRVSPLVSVAAQLTQGEVIDVFEVDTPAPYYWRMTALERFDGIEWSPADEPETIVTPGQELTQGSDRTVETTFTVLNDIGYAWLPTAMRPRSIEVDRSASWAPGTQTLRVDEPLDAGDRYSVVSTYPAPTAADLAAEVFPDPSSHPSLVALPDDLPTGIEELAAAWTADADNDYERVMALEDALTDPGSFTYSLEVSPREDVDSLTEFLTVTRRGFCQQFASAMAVMLRSLGIPARVAVGYTAGEMAPGGVRRVTTADLHAWVEVLFPTYGWLPFEPTPGRSNPVMRAYTAPIVEPEPGQGACTRRNPANPACRDDAAVDPVDPRIDDPVISETIEGQEAPRSDRTPMVVALGILAAAVVLLLAIPGRRAWRRRRLLRRAGDEPRRLILASYDVFADRAAELGLPRGIGETPREYAYRVGTDGRVPEGRVDRLASLVTRAAYAPTEPSPEDALDAAADAQVALQELAGATPLTRRLAGRLRLR